MNVQKVEPLVKDIIKKHNLKFYSICQKKAYGANILEVLIDNSVSHDVLDSLTSDILDEINDYLPDNYLLEVSTVGPERPLNSLDEVIGAVGQYVNVTSGKYCGDATLIGVDNEILELKTFIKGKPTTIKISYKDIAKIRKAIKF